MNIKSLTGLRFFAAASIVLGHFASSVNLTIGNLDASMGNLTILGMPLFFVLSGFLIHLHYSNSLGGKDQWTACAEFAIARIARIYPLFLFFFIIYLFAQGVLDKFLRDFSYRDLLISYLTGTFSWVPIAVDGKILSELFYGLSWSVSTELFFYVLYPFYSQKITRIGSPKKIFSILIIFWLISISTLYFLYSYKEIIVDNYSNLFPSIPNDSDNFTNSFYRWFFYISPYTRILEFLSGVLVAQLYISIKNIEVKIIDDSNGFLLSLISIFLIIIFFISMLFAFDGLWDFYGHRGFIIFLHMNFFFAIPISILIFCLARYKNSLTNFFEFSIFIYLGEISYSLYLGHPLVSQIISFPKNGQLDFYTAFSLIIEFILIIMLSVGTFRLVEAPGRRYIRECFVKKIATPLRAKILCYIILLALICGFIYGLSRSSSNFKEHSNINLPYSNSLEIVPSMKIVNLNLPPSNKLWPSEGFINGNWAPPENAKITTAMEAVPNENSTSIFLEELALNGRHRIESVTPNLMPDQQHVYSFHAKPFGRNQVLLELRDTKNIQYGRLTYNIKTGKVLDMMGNVQDGGCLPLGKGWYRCWGSFKPGSNTGVATISLVNDAGGHNYHGLSNHGVLLWGVQLTQGDDLITYTPTIDSPK
jgi:peptidoglycan/LPS O-acetylase OafA/YrhL